MMMKSSKLKLVRLSMRLANSVSSTRHSLPSLTQVSPFHFHHFHLFSSKPHSFFHSSLSLSLSNDINWSHKLESDLDKLTPILTHDSVLYALMSFDTNPQKALGFFKWVSDNKGFRPSASAYFVLLRALACEDCIAQFWNVFAEIRDRGFYIDYKTYSIINIKLTSEKLAFESAEWTKRYREMLKLDVDKGLVKEVSDFILLRDWGEDVERQLKEKLMFPLRENLLLRLIAELSPQPFKGFKFFEWVGCSGGYQHDGVTYNAMAHVLAHHNSVSLFWDFVKQMKKDGYEIDIYTYMTSWKNLPLKDAVELFELMMDGPYQPSLQHSVMLLTKITREASSDLDLVYRVFNKFVAAGNLPSKALYDGVHRTLCNLGRFDEAKKIVEDMRNSGYKPDNLTYSHEISGLCKSGMFEEACNVLDQMEVEGCVPAVTTWTMLIKGHCEANRVDEALLCYLKMKEKDVHPNHETLSVLTKGFISENKVLDAYRFFTELVKKEGQLQPQLDTYKLIIEKLAEAGKLEEALDVLSMMKKQKIRVFPQPITQYISKCGTVDDAKRLLRVLSPNANTVIKVYGKVIEAFIKKGRFSEAKDLVRASPLDVRQDKAILNMFASEQVAPLKEVS